MSSFWNQRKVLVTGAGGYTGSNLTIRLAKEGALVRAFVRTAGSRQPLPNGVEVFEGDLTSGDDCRRAVSGVDTVFHVAAVYREVKPSRDYLAAVHVGSTEKLMRAAKEAGCRRFVHTSTIGVHGHIERGPADEESPYGPGDDYQETKLEGELLARGLSRELEMPLTVVRPCAIYGPGDMRFLKLVRPIKNRRFVMIGSGETHYHFVYIDDLVEGFLLAAEKEGAIGEVFIIGGPNRPTLNELAHTVARVLNVSPPRLRVPVWPVYGAAWICEKLCKAIGIEPPLHPRRVAFFTKNREFRIDKAKRLLGFEPKVGLVEGFGRTIAWYREERLL
jgi:dihydroflavonol-4-reductase